VIAAQASRSIRPGRTAATVALTAALLSVAVTGCGGRLDSGTTRNSTATSGPAAQQEGSGRAGTDAGGSALDQQTAGQIEGAVNEAQSELDGLDQDFAADASASN
jgi:hypothetical protein